MASINGESPNAAGSSFKALKSDRAGRRDETSCKASGLRRQYLDARARLDESTALVARGLDLIEDLGWGVMGEKQARAAVRDFNLAGLLLRQGRRGDE